MSRYKHQQSAYCYTGTDVLKNKENIRDQLALERYERIMTSLRSAELYKYPIAGDFDLSHISLIHKYLFRDVYTFAGQIRTESISKGQFTFALPQFIEQQTTIMCDQLRAERYLANLSDEAFAVRAAYYMSELNVIHPFREGNGRTQREFIRCLAFKNGYELNWEHTNPQELLYASVRSVANSDELVTHIHKCLINKKSDPQIAQTYKVRTQR